MDTDRNMGAKAAPRPRIAFDYGGGSAAPALRAKTVREEADGRLAETFRLPGGLEVTTVSVRHGGAVEWVAWFENRGSEKTRQISSPCDRGVAPPFGPDPIIGSRAFASGEGAVVVYARRERLGFEHAWIAGGWHGRFASPSSKRGRP